MRRALAHVAEPLEPRRLLAVFLHDEGVGVPEDPLFYPYANFLYFSGGAPDAVGLWENNGGPGLTHIAFGSFPGPASYYPDSIALLTNPQLPTYQDKYVTGDHAQGGRALYRRNEFNGAETVVARFASIGQLNVLDATTIVFVADGNDGAGEELWRTDGTPAGTVRVSDIKPGPAGASITGMTVINRTAVFSADDGSAGVELWASDGTAAGTRLATDINPGPAGSNPRDFFPVGTRLTFNATTPQYGSELWSTGFGAAGTALVVDAYPGPASSGMTAAISPAGAEFYAFTRGDAPLEMYRIDANPAQLTLIKHISDEPAGDRLIRPVGLKDSGGSGYQVFLFGGSDKATGLEPWRSDGTPEGTYLIRDVNPGPADSMAADASIASIWGNRAFFAATGPGGPAGVPVLWTTTGTAAGTHAAAAPDGRLAYRPTNVVDAYRNAFFAASATPDAGAARTLWIARQDAPVYRITGNVWHDRNANGVREGADVGVRGVTVYADLDGDASPDPDEPFVVAGGEFGFYSLSVPAGTYTVRVVPPPGYFTSAPSGGGQTVAVGPSDAGTGDFFVYTTGAAHLMLFNDLDGNGVQGDGEGPLAGRTFYDDANNNDRLDPGEIVGVTGPDGVARFEGLMPRTYRFRQVLPPGWSQTPFSQDVINANVISGGTVTTERGSRQPPVTGTLAGTVYEDANANRRRDAGELGLAGRMVYIDADHDGAYDSGEFTTTTGPDGAYAFAVATPALHYVRVIHPDGWTPTAPTGGLAVNYGVWVAATLAGSENLQNLDLGAVNALPASIAGEAYDDLDADGTRDPGEPALTGASAVYIDFNDNAAREPLDEPMSFVDSSGRFEFPSVPPGTYTLRLTLPSTNYVRTDPLRDERGRDPGHTVTVAAGEDLAGMHFGAVARSSVGSVLARAFTDTNGNGNRELNESFAAERIVYIDADNDGVLDPGERRMITTNEGATFDALRPGTYTLRAVTPDGFRRTAPAATDAFTITVGAGQTNQAPLWGFAAATTPSAISGVVYTDTNGNGRRDAGEPARSGTQVFLDLNNDGARNITEPAAAADVNGFYSITNLPPGNYVVRAVLGSTLTATHPASARYDVTLGANSLAGGKDFGVLSTSQLGRVTGIVFDDANGNGVRDAGEPAPAGRVVWIDADSDGTLDAGEVTATQGVDGYTLTGVLPGVHALWIILPDGMRQTLPADGGPRVISVALGQTTTAQPFGLQVAPPDSTPPTVAGVFAQGSAWAEDFTWWFADDESLALGYPLPAGASAGGTRTLPWANADTIAVVFSEDVRVKAADLRVSGVGGNYAVADFSYNRFTRTATWKLSSPFRADRVRIEVDGDAGGVTDRAGNPLHGVGGAAAGDHARAFNVLPGDATGDGRTDALDTALVRRRLSSTAFGEAFARYSAFCDVDANGKIDALDLAALRTRMGESLPPPPAATAIAIGSRTRQVGASRSLYSTRPILPA